MRDISKHVLERYASKQLLGILEVDLSEPNTKLRLSALTLERIHDIAAYRYYVKDEALALRVLVHLGPRLG